MPLITQVADITALDRALFDANPDLVWELDIDGTVRRTNARSVVMLGFTSDALAGRAIGELAMPDARADLEHAVADALAGRTSVVWCAIRHRDGRAVPIRASLLPVLVDDVVVGVYVHGQEVAAESRAQQKLREGEALYRALVEQLPECVAIFANGRYEFVNPAGAAMRGPGYTPADVEGHRWTEFVDPEDRATYGGTLAELEAAPPGTVRTFDSRFRWPNGHRVEVEVVAIAVRLNGRPAVHCFATDVTARRRIEGERLRAQRMESLGRLAAGVAHDFNNLLAVMLIAIESAAGAVTDDGPLRDDLADAADAARRGRALTRQLLTFARRQESRPTVIALNDVVRNMTDLLRRVGGARTRLTVALAEDAGTIVADPGQIEQALLNLVTNARDAMPDGGTVTVETAVLDGEVRLSVTDTGEGIAPELRSQLFEPFFTTKADGYGLGLATVYGVVTAAGGRVDVDSTPGEGTAFHLYFPRAVPGD